MMDYHSDINIEQLKEQLQQARDNLTQLRIDFKDDEELLNIYEPSLRHFVQELENDLSKIASKEYGIELRVAEEESAKVDFWVSINGEEFKEGEGPIGHVGAFLTRLNNANKQATEVVSKKRGRSFRPSQVPGLRLVTTKTGSLKLGLNRPHIKAPEKTNQIEMFEDGWDKFKAGVEDAELPAIGMQLLVKTIAAVNDEKILNKLKEDYGEKEVIKIIHYAKELAPSNRSPIEYVKFEGDYVNLPSKSLQTNKDTRKVLAKLAKEIMPTTSYIEGVAFIGQADVNGHIIARPLNYSGIKHEEIRCEFTKSIGAEEISQLFNKKVAVKGYLVSDRNGRLLRLEIDDFTLLSDVKQIDSFIEAAVFQEEED